jgi:ATP-binding cassette, subfamily F, member 3
MLSLSNLTYRIAGRTLMDNCSLSLNTGWKVGFVGSNGTGKSTLFRLITGELEADGGAIQRPARQRLGIVKQELPDTDDSLLDIVMSADAERLDLLRRTEIETDGNELAEIYTRLQEIDAYTAPARAATILSGLGFNESQMNGKLADLSGGWRMRVALASILFYQPDLLLLDEPTNHLDLEAIIWLQAYLANYPHSLIVISHDRELLNTCADHIVHLHDQKLTLYNGDYDTFERTRSERLILQEKEAAKQKARRAHIQSFIDRFRAKATKARQAQSRIKMLEKMDIIDDVMMSRSVRFKFPVPKELAPPLLSLNEVSIGYGSKTILRGVHETIDADDRIALLGANGNGKSTLIKLLAGKLEPLAGDRVGSGKLRIGYFAQHQTEELDLAISPYLAMRRRCEDLGEDSKEAIVRARLGSFGFSKELSDGTIGSLSGGEKARLMFALISVQAPHILLLDEPTNHLDMEARAALAEALNDYRGAVVLVSHDPALLERVADRLWLVHKGKVQDFDGDLSDYRKFVLDQQRTQRKADKAARADEKAEARKESAEKRRQLAPLAKRVELAQKHIAQLTKEKEQLEDLMAQPDFYGNTAHVGATQQQHGQLCKQLEQAEAAWLELQMEYEAALAAD